MSKKFIIAEITFPVPELSRNAFLTVQKAGKNRRAPLRQQWFVNLLSYVVFAVFTG